MKFRELAYLVEAMSPYADLIQKLNQVIDTYAQAYAVGGARAGYQALIDAGHSPEAAKSFVKTYEKIKGATKDQVKRDMKAQGMDIDAAMKESLPISGPPGATMKKHGDGLPKAKALELAKKLRAQGIFASVFPSDEVPNKRMVISWER